MAFLLTIRVSADVSGPSAVERRPVQPAPGAAGTVRVTPSTALTRVAPHAPDEAATTTGQPLGRSGLDLLDLLTTTDVVSARGQTGTVALAVGLEQSRAALLRNLPGDSLAALDQVWAGASRTEEGWYLRSGALTMMGLPGESDRVAGDGLVAKPESLALRFLQSLARLATGDISGARAALQPALARAPFEPVLLVQQALVLARQGDRAGAERVLSDLATREPDHPAVPWGRAALLSVVTDATRQRSRPTPVDWPSAVSDPASSQRGMGETDVAGDIFGAIHPAEDHDPETGREAAPLDQDVRLTSARRGATADVTAAALERFGARVAMRPEAEVAREARMLIRAFSAGGTLSTAVNADQAHAARVVLTTLLGVAGGDPHIDATDSGATVRTIVAQLVPLLRQGRSADADAMVRRQSMLAREPIGRLLLSVIRGAALSEQQAGGITGDAAGRPPASTDRITTPSAGSSVVFGETDRGPMVPVRLGLALLAEAPASRQMHSTPTWTSSELALMGADGRPTGVTTGGFHTMPNDEQALRGWGAALSGGGSNTPWSEGAGVRAVALVCVMMAMGALVTGHGVIAIALGVGSAWLGLRRSGGERYTSHHDPAEPLRDRDRVVVHDDVRPR